MGINIGYTVENKGDFTEITPEIKKTVAAGLVTKPTYANLYVGKSADGDHFDIGFMTIRPGDTKPSPVVLEQIPVQNIGTKGIKVNGSVTLGNISFYQLNDVDHKAKVDEKTGEALVDTNKSVEIIGTPEADHVVIDGDLGKTKVAAKLDKGDDTLIIEQNAIGAIDVDFGEGDKDLLWNARSNNNDSIFEVNELVGAMKASPEKNKSGEFSYIK